MKNFTNLVFALTLSFLLSAQINAQSSSLHSVSNPNLEQKRLDAAQPTVTQPQAKTDPMAMAHKYEETAIRRWRTKHPKVKCIPAAKFSALSPQQKTELDSQSEYIVFEEELRWADIEKYKALKK